MGSDPNPYRYRCAVQGPLGDAAIAALRTGDVVAVRRHIDETTTRARHVSSWIVEVEQVIRLERGLWVLVPGGADPHHPLDFVVGVAVGMRTEIHPVPDDAAFLVAGAGRDSSHPRVH